MVTQLEYFGPLDQHTFDHLNDIVFRSDSRLNVMLEIGIHKLVKTSDRMVVSRILYLIDQMNEPEELHCLIESLRRIFRNTFASHGNT